VYFGFLLFFWLISVDFGTMMGLLLLAMALCCIFDGVLGVLWRKTCLSSYGF
jgi:small neutral amino acid transporter SnatA (MarC family)